MFFIHIGRLVHPRFIHSHSGKKKKHSGFHTLLPSKLQEPFSCAGGVSGAEPPILGSDGIGENTKQRPWTLLVTPRSSSPPGKCPAVKLSIWGNGQTILQTSKNRLRVSTGYDIYITVIWKIWKVPNLQKKYQKIGQPQRKISQKSMGFDHVLNRNRMAGLFPSFGAGDLPYAAHLRTVGWIYRVKKPTHWLKICMDLL